MTTHLGYNLSKQRNFASLTENFSSSFSGTFNIFVRADGAEKLVSCYDNRGSFGELALMYNTPRAATIIATSTGALWCLVSDLKFTQLFFFFTCAVGFLAYSNTKALLLPVAV